MARDTTERDAAQPVFGLDQEGSPGTDFPRLYKLWEASNWSASTIDFAQDASDWRERVTPRQGRAGRWRLALRLPALLGA